MKKFALLLTLLLCFPAYAGEQTVDGMTNDGHSIQNSGAYLPQQPILDFISGVKAVNSGSKTQVSADLTALASTFIKLDGSNANTTINIGSQPFTTTGTLGAGAITGTSLTDSGLHSGYITYSTTGGLLTDSANLVFDGTNLTIGGGGPVYPFTCHGAGYLYKTQNAGTPFFIVNQATVGVGNTGANAQLVVQSGDSSGFFGAWPSDAGNTIWQKKVVFGANSDATGFVLNAPTAGNTIDFYAGSTTTGMRLSSVGLYVGGITSPTAVLHLKAGTATAGTAPFKMTAGTVTTVAIAGQVEYTTGLFQIRADDLYVAQDIKAATYHVGADAGIDATITTADLVGKTITIKKGLITGYA